MVIREGDIFRRKFLGELVVFRMDTLVDAKKTPKGLLNFLLGELR